MRFDMIAALGAVHMRTPALDQLVHSGTSFTGAYSPCPVCVPARCSMIYGQYPQNTGCYENTSMPVDDRRSFMDVLTEAGYRTHGIGKCHFVPDSRALRGFQTREMQEEMPKSPEHDDFLTLIRREGFDHVVDPHGARGEMYYIPQISQLPSRLHPTQWVGDRACSFISRQRSAASSQPWYLYAGFIHPHPPFSPPAPWHKLYGFEDVPFPHIPTDHEDLLTYVNRAQNRYKYRDRGFDLNLVRIMRAYYYACISFIDYQVGRMIDALGSSYDETLIVFSSDHGEYLGDYACFGKRGMHDVSARIPLIVSHPSTLPAGLTCARPANLVDIAPTFSRASGAEATAPAWDGVPLQDVAAGTTGREHVFSHLAYTTGYFGVRNRSLDNPKTSEAYHRASVSLYMAVSETHKYVYSAPDNAEFLFDRIRDSRETRNCVGDADQCEHAEKMKSVLFRHLVAGGETEGVTISHEEGRERYAWRPMPRKEMPSDPDAGLLIQNQPWADLCIPGYSRT